MFREEFNLGYKLRKCVNILFAVTRANGLIKIKEYKERNYNYRTAFITLVNIPVLQLYLHYTFIDRCLEFENFGINL